MGGNRMGMVHGKKYWIQFAFLVLLVLCIIPPALAYNTTAVEWFRKGNTFRQNHQDQEALDAYNEALSFDPDYWEAWNNKGTALYHLGRYDEALDAINRSLSLNPDFPNAWNNKGLILQSLGRYQEALDAYDKALSINPDYTEAQSNREKLPKSNSTLATMNPTEVRRSPLKSPEPKNPSAFINLGFKPVPVGIEWCVLAIGVGVFISRKKW
jgi:tetratricopeptide (TPR) repeat protein